MRKLLFSLFAVAAGFVACEKDDVNALDARLDKVEGYQVSAQNQIDQLNADLNEAVEDLNAAIIAGDLNAVQLAGDVIASTVDALGTSITTQILASVEGAKDLASIIKLQGGLDLGRSDALQVLAESGDATAFAELVGGKLTTSRLSVPDGIYADGTFGTPSNVLAHTAEFEVADVKYQAWMVAPSEFTGVPGVNDNFVIAWADGAARFDYGTKDANSDGVIRLLLSAVKGDTGATGATGVQGPAGAQGIQGPAGSNGANGSDADATEALEALAALVELNAIAIESSYDTLAGSIVQAIDVINASIIASGNNILRVAGVSITNLEVAFTAALEREQNARIANDQYLYDLIDSSVNALTLAIELEITAREAGDTENGDALAAAIVDLTAALSQGDNDAVNEARQNTIQTMASLVSAYNAKITDLQAQIDALELEAGVVGPAGPQGPQGPAGPAGPAGQDGTDGTNGTNGVDGTNGTDGVDGVDGVDGQDGQDATGTVSDTVEVPDTADTLSTWSTWAPIDADKAAPTTQEFITEERTRSVVQNGDLDAVAPAGDLSETRTVANPGYVVPNGADTIVFGDWVLGTETGGGITVGTAASSVASVTETTAAIVRVDTRDFSVTVVDAADSPAPIAAAADLTRTVTVAAESTRQVANTAYVAPTQQFDPKDSDQDGDVDYADAVAAGFTVDVAGAIGGWRLTYSDATGLTSGIVSNGTIQQARASFDTITVALATEYAEGLVLAAYIAS